MTGTRNPNEQRAIKAEANGDYASAAYLYECAQWLYATQLRERPPGNRTALRGRISACIMSRARCLHQIEMEGARAERQAILSGNG